MENMIQNEVLVEGAIEAVDLIPTTEAVETVGFLGKILKPAGKVAGAVVIAAAIYGGYKYIQKKKAAKTEIVDVMSEDLNVDEEDFDEE